MSIVLFLGYDETETILISKLKSKNCNVKQTKKKLTFEFSEYYDLIISFGYKYIFKPQFIENCNCPILNLHISYLPFNRGAHPNFWSFFDKTQSGVSIHLIDEGIDTGPILFQKKVEFLHEKTFIETYRRLHYEIENLFIDHIDSIISKKWIEKKQSGIGTFHFARDLPKNFSGWNSNIVDEIIRLKNE